MKRSLELMAANALGHLVQADRICSLAKYLFLQQLMSKLRIAEVLDVGANAGQFALAVRAIGFCGNILSFEPIPDVFETLTKTMGHDVNWSGQNVALGEAEEVRDLNVMQYTVYSSFRRPVDFDGGANQIVRTCPVRVRRLDNILGERNLRRTMLKVDTQGYELQVFRGLGSRLASLRAIMCEVNVNALYEGVAPMHEVIAFLNANGFKAALFVPVNRMGDLSAREFDYICIRPETV